MERFLNWLDRRLGRHAPHGLGIYLVGFWAMATMVLYAKPDLAGDFTLDRAGLLRGEVWRLATFLLLPPSLGRGPLDLIFALFVLLFFYTVLTSLEAEWGPVRLWTYYLIGALGTVAGALLTGSANNAYLNLSLLLAFATVFPDYEILLFFILPVKMKWLGLLDAAFLVYAFITGGAPSRAAIAMAFLNYSLFFGAHLVDLLRGKARQVGRRSQSARLEQFRELSGRPARKVRVCAKCGKSEADDPHLEFRVCDCEKCGGKPTDYCLEHARAH
jgi:hypothetical protein